VSSPGVSSAMILRGSQWLFGDLRRYWLVMKPSGASTSFISRSLDLFSKHPEKLQATEQAKPALPEPEAQELTQPDQSHTEFLRRQAQKQVAAANRSRLKTRRLLELCAQVRQGKRQSGDWFAKHEKFFRSPVWRLVSDEALLKAHFKCEYSGCTGHATQVQLLEFPQEHLEPNFNWMKRDDILIALCNRHYEIMHGFVMKRLVSSDQPFDPAMPGIINISDVGEYLHSTLRPGAHL